MLAWNWVIHQFAVRPFGPSGEAVDPLTALYGCLFYAFFSLIACGLQTLLASSATGVLAVALHSQLTRVRS